MPVLDSGLETFDYGTAGWSAIMKSNIEKIDEKLLGPFGADNALGSQTVADNSTTQADPAAATASTLTDSTTGTPGGTISDVGASFDQATLNNNLASLAAQVNALIADNADLRTKLAGTIDYCDSLKATINTLQGKLRKTGGSGVFDDNP